MQREDVEKRKPLRPDIQFLNQVIDELNKYMKENPSIFLGKNMKKNIEEIEAIQGVMDLIYQYAYKKDAPHIGHIDSFEKLSFNEQLLPATPEAFRILHKKMVAVLQKMKIGFLQESKLQKNMTQLLNKLSQTAYDNFKQEWSILNPQNINTLPLDVLSEILSYTNLSQRKSITCVNKNFNQASIKNNVWESYINSELKEKHKDQEKRPKETNKEYVQRLFKAPNEKIFLVLWYKDDVKVLEMLNSEKFLDEKKNILQENGNICDTYDNALVYRTGRELKQLRSLSTFSSYIIEINLSKQKYIQYRDEQNLEAIRKKIVTISDPTFEHIRTTYIDGKLVETEAPSNKPSSKG